MLGDRVEQLDVQLGVVLGQRLVAVVVDELHHRAEGQRVREAVLPLPVEDLDQLVVASFPAVGTRSSETLPAALTLTDQQREPFSSGESEVSESSSD